MKITASALLLISYQFHNEGSTQAFVIPTPSGRHPNHHQSLLGVATNMRYHYQSKNQLFFSASEGVVNHNDNSHNNEDEVERLRLMAAKLRIEAAELAEEQALKVSSAARKVFEKFDLNGDGVVNTEELKIGLSKQLKLSNKDDTLLSDQKMKQLINKFDRDGDGSLRLEEFGTLDQFQNQLDAIVRDEKIAQREMTKITQKQKEEEQIRELQLAMFNEGEPTSKERILSVLPYLFPLLDGLQFAALFVTNHPDNITAQLLALAYTAYRSIPFQGFIGFFILSILSNNLSLNKLIRFNLQQAIFLDIALIIPGLIGGLFSVVASGVQLPPETYELASNFVLVSLFATIGYASISSLLGITPDKIPIMSKAVQDRMFTPDMFDERGQFIGRGDDDDDKTEKKD